MEIFCASKFKSSILLLGEDEVLARIERGDDVSMLEKNSAETIDSEVYALTKALRIEFSEFKTLSLTLMDSFMFTVNSELDREYFAEKVIALMQVNAPVLYSAELRIGVASYEKGVIQLDLQLKRNKFKQFGGIKFTRNNEKE